MASQLINLRRTLAWSDFAGRVPPGTPWAAMTSSNFTVSKPRFQDTGGGFNLTDDVTVTVTFGKESWVHPNVSTYTSLQQQFLLDHEQQHYNITALVARDLFIQLMKLKSANTATQAEVEGRFRNLETQYRATSGRLQNKYDDDTGHSQSNVFVPSTSMFTPPPTKGSDQIKWESVIANAFTRLRLPPDSAPDGTPYKEELETLVKQHPNIIYP